MPDGATPHYPLPACHDSVPRELGQLHADAFEMQAGDFFVQMLRQAIDADFVRGAVLPEVQLREALAANLSSRALDGRWRDPLKASLPHFIASL